LEAEDVRLKLSSVCNPEREKCADKSWSSTENVVSAVNRHLREKFSYLYDAEGARWDDMKVAHNATCLPDEPHKSDYALGLSLQVPLTGTTVQPTLQKKFLAFYRTQILTL
jgi:hypothetical protein